MKCDKYDKCTVTTCGNCANAKTMIDGSTWLKDMNMVWCTLADNPHRAKRTDVCSHYKKAVKENETMDLPRFTKW